MLSKLQEGIYHRKEPPIGNSFCIISLRAEHSAKIGQIGMAIAGLWKCLLKLKNGITTDFETDRRHRKIGNLTILIGYGPKVFEIVGSKKTRPASFADIWNFKSPNHEGGGPVLEGSGMTYSSKVFENHLLSDHIIFQFIADNDFYTNRAAVEVWKELCRLEKNTGYKPIWITGLYTGFQREDKRNWLGFHDGISNLKSHERPYVISINSRYLSSDDKWILNGTYLAFMRIAIDLKRWDDYTRRDQEIIIGRDKITGCPLDLDRNGNFTKVSGCPAPGTSQVIDPGNERFRDHPPYTNNTLQFSHVGSTRPIDRIPVWDRKSSRIFRQGFEFLETSSNPFVLLPGLNFVSFQNTPERLFRSLTYGSKNERKNIRNSLTPRLEKFLSVHAAGIFLVPPSTLNEPFPGAKIFGVSK